MELQPAGSLSSRTTWWSEGFHRSTLTLSLQAELKELLPDRRLEDNMKTCASGGSLASVLLTPLQSKQNHQL